MYMHTFSQLKADKAFSAKFQRQKGKGMSYICWKYFPPLCFDQSVTLPCHLANTTFSLLIEPSPVSPPQPRAGAATPHITFLWAHLLSERKPTYTYTGSAHAGIFFCWVLHYSFKMGKSAFSSAPWHLQLSWNSRDKATDLPQLKPVHPFWWRAP